MLPCCVRDSSVVLNNVPRLELVARSSVLDIGSSSYTPSPVFGRASALERRDMGGYFSRIRRGAASGGMGMSTETFCVAALLAVAMDGDDVSEVAGTLVHEMFHSVMRAVYQNDCNPFHAPAGALHEGEARWKGYLSHLKTNYSLLLERFRSDELYTRYLENLMACDRGDYPTSGYQLGELGARAIECFVPPGNQYGRGQAFLELVCPGLAAEFSPSGKLFNDVMYFVERRQYPNYESLGWNFPRPRFPGY